MRSLRCSSLVLSALLQCLPMVRVITVQSLTSASPILAILRFISGATAVAGSFHAVSGASITLVSPSGGKVHATNGVSSPFRIEMTYSDGGALLKPAIYDAVNLPPGFNQPSKSGAIFRITGTPTKTGIFSNVQVTGYEHSNKIGHQATVVLTITVVDGQLTIIQPPVGFTGTAGTTAQLQVTASGGTLTYQWLKDDLELTGETASTLSFIPLTTDDTGTYRVRVQNGSGGLVLSDPVVVTVIPNVQPPTFTRNPQSITVHEGEAFALTSTATADGPVTFAWSKDERPVPDATGSDLPFPKATPGNGGSYRVSATGSGGTSTSLPAVVTVVSPLVLGTPVTESSQLRLPFNGIAGRTYVLESAINLSQPVWIASGELVASSNSAFIIVTPTDGNRWYRIRVR